MQAFSSTHSQYHCKPHCCLSCCFDPAKPGNCSSAEPVPGFAGSTPYPNTCSCLVTPLTICCSAVKTCWIMKDAWRKEHGTYMYLQHCCFCLLILFNQPWLETRECQACLVDKHRFLCQMKLCGCRNSVHVCFPEGKYTHWIPAVRPHSMANTSEPPGAMQRERTGPQASGPISVLNQTDLDLKSKGC